MNRADPPHLTVPFTAPDAWKGGYYELAIELGPRDDNRLSTAHRAIWDAVCVEGLYESTKAEPAHQARLNPDMANLLDQSFGAGGYYGIAQLPNGISLPAGTSIVRESIGPDGRLMMPQDSQEFRPDWLVFFIPMGALGYVYPVGGWPFGGDKQSATWREPLNRWLIELGQNIFDRTPFRLALIGLEVSGKVYAEDIMKNGIPEARFIDYLWPTEGQLRSYPYNSQ